MPVGISSAWPGREHERRIQAGAQVEPGAARRRIGGQLRRPCAGRARRSSIVARGHAASRHDSRGDLGDELRAPASSLSALAAARAMPCASTSSSALSSRPKVAGPRLPTMSGMPLRSRLARACVEQVLALGGKADAERRAAGSARHGGEDVRVLGQLELGAPCPPSFLIFCSDSRAGRQSATAAVATNTSRAAPPAAAPRRASRCAVVTSMRRTPRGVGRCTGPATSVTSAPASRAARAIGEAHLAARQVGDAAHRVDRLEGRPGGDEHALAEQRLRLEERDQLLEQLVGLEHAAVADLAAGLLAAAHAEHGGAVGRDLRAGCAASPGAPTSRGSWPARRAAGSARSAAPGTAAAAARPRARARAAR